MPVYSFMCPECDYTCEVTRPMKDSGKPVFCLCGLEMRRDFATDFINTGNKDYGKPIHSDALAISPSQRAEHEKKFPDIKLDSQCRPIFDNFRKHEDYMKKCGIVKHRNRKGKRRSCSKIIT